MREPLVRRLTTVLAVVTIAALGGSSALPLSARASVEPTGPGRLHVIQACCYENPDRTEVDAYPWATGWPAGTDLTLEVDRGDDGSIDSTQVAASPAVFQVSPMTAPGDRIRVTGQGGSKDIVIEAVRVEYVNAATDTVAGIAPANRSITINAPPGSENEVSTTTDGTGRWTVSFAGTYDIPAASPDEPPTDNAKSVGAYLPEPTPDGDEMRAYGFAYLPRVIVQPTCCGGRTGIGTQGWTYGTTLTMQFDQGNNGTYEHSAVGIVNSPVLPANFTLPIGMEAVPGDRVRVSGGGWTKDVIVEPLRVEYVNATTDVVAGSAPADRPVSVVARTGGSQHTLDVTANGSGRWTADFSGLIDIAPQPIGSPSGTGGSAEASLVEAAGDGDLTRTAQEAYQARIVVTPVGGGGNSSIGPEGWTDGTPITLQIDQGNNGSYDYTDGTQVAPTSFSLAAGPHLVVGDRVRVSGGGWVKDLIVETLRVEYVNAATDVVAGNSPPNRSVAVTARSGGDEDTLTVTANGSGRWTADFTGLVDIAPREYGSPYGSGGSAEASLVEPAGDGDLTRSGQDAFTPRIVADPFPGGGSSIVAAEGWADGTALTLGLDHGNNGSYEYTDSTLVAPARVTLPAGTVAEPGDRIRITGGGWTKDLSVVALRVEYVDAATDVVAGISPPGRAVAVTARSGGDEDTLTVTANGSGRWSADFTGLVDIAPRPYGSPPGTGGSATALLTEAPGDGDVIQAEHDAVTPRITVEPSNAVGDTTIATEGWTDRTPLTLQLDHGNNGTYEYTDSSKTAPTSYTLPAGTLALPGDRVRVVGGGWTRDLIVPPLTITSANVLTDVLRGTATPGSTVRVHIRTEGGPTLTVVADSEGAWTVDTTSAHDLDVGEGYDAQVTDPDGDITIVIGQADDPRPRLTAAPTTGLVDDQVITVGGTMWPIGRPVFVTECVLGESPSAASCDPSTTTSYTADGSSDIAGTFTVARSLTVDIPDPDSAHNCAIAAGGCGLVAAVWPGDVPFSGPAEATDPLGPTPLAFPPAPLPAAPGTPTVTGVNTTGISVSWTPPVPAAFPILSYDVLVYVSNASEPFQTISRPPSATTATVPIPTPGTIYRIRVRAVNESGAGPVSGPSVRALPPFRTLDGFTDRQYRDFAGRAPTSAELGSWRTPLTNDATNAADQVDRAIDFSNWGPKQSPVIRLFRAYFLRLPDTGGLNYWTGRYRSGTSLTKISDSFATSSEFTRRYGSLSNRKFVVLVYTNVLGRAGDTAGINYWTGQLDRHKKSRGQVMLGFSESSEYIRKSQPVVDVVNIFSGMLRRVPTPSEGTTWEPLLRAGTPRTQLITAILGSAAYDARIPA